MDMVCDLPYHMIFMIHNVMLFDMLYDMLD